MHIITGLALAGLAKVYAAQQHADGLPRFKTGPLRVAHAISGRLRLYAPSLRGRDAAQLDWVDAVKGLAGIDDVQVNTITGSIVVRYRAGAVEPLMIFEAIARLTGVEKALHQPPPPLAVRELRAMGDSLNRAVYDATAGVADLWTLLMFGFVALGTKKTIETGWGAFPAGFTLVWWALHGLSNTGPKGL